MITRPLTDFLGKDGFKWSEKASHSLEQLKASLISTHVLQDFTKGFVVETDASSMGIEVVLMQEGHPISFISKS